MREVDSTTFEVVIDGLEEYVNYSVSVYGKTTAGVGETATADLRLYSAGRDLCIMYIFSATLII